MTDATTAAAIAEHIGLIVDYGNEHGTFSLTVFNDGAGDYGASFIFGSEAPGSPMAGGASYGFDPTVAGALKQIVDECRLLEKRDGDRAGASSEVEQ